MTGRSRTVHLFDKHQLQTAVSRMRQGLSVFDVAKTLGLPAYAVSALCDAGLIDEITDRSVVIMARKILIDPKSVEFFDRTLSSLPEPPETVDLVCLSVALRNDLSPFVWAAAFGAITSGEQMAFARKHGHSWAAKVFVQGDALRTRLKAARAGPLPDIDIAAIVASPIIGLNQIVLGRAVEAGLLYRNSKGIPLAELARFRTAYVGPSEIAEWYKGSGLAFARTMASVGVKPAANLHKANLWHRADVDRVFGGKETE